MLRWTRRARAAFVAAIAVAGVALAAPLIAAPSTRCAELFPDVAWVGSESDVVDIGFSDVPHGRAKRFANEIEFTALAVEAEIGGLSDAAVCVVGSESGSIAERYLEPTKRFHAILDHPNQVLLLSATSPGNIKKAAAFGVPHLALWNVNEGGWPEPLASTIAQWYRARALDRMDQYRVQSTGADFSVDPLTGESEFGLDFSTDARIAWTESVQPPLRAWDPERNDAPIGYFIEYVVAHEGLQSLTGQDSAEWSAREEDWRQSLVVDMTGRTEPTTGWITGVGLAGLVVFAATALALGSVIVKRRRRLSSRQSE